jgi:Mg2+ and Co2+ transporter CorA
MSMPKQTPLNENLVQNYRQFIDNLEKSLDLVEDQLNEAAEMTEICTSEWCEATDHVMDDLGNFLFSISEPKGASEEDTQRLKGLKRRLHDLYAQYKSTAGEIS